MTETSLAVGPESRAAIAPRRLTIVVPALNEEHNIGATLAVVTAAAERHLNDYEIIVVDDGSTDGTARVASEFALLHPGKITVHRQPVNRGLGVSYLYGLEQARFEYLSVIPGDNVFQPVAFDNVFPLIGSAPLIVSYRGTEERTRLRKFLSVMCTLMMRTVTGKPIRDAHGMFVYPVAIARQIPVRTGYSYHIDSLGRLLCILPRFVQVSAPLNPRPDASSGVMRPKVIFRLVWAMTRLGFWRLTAKHHRVQIAEPNAPANAKRQS